MVSRIPNTNNMQTDQFDRIRTDTTSPAQSGPESNGKLQN